MNEPTPEELRKKGVKWPGNMKMKMVRAYGPSMRERIRSFQNLEDLEAFWADLRSMITSKQVRLTNSAVNKLNKVAAAKHAELSAQKIIRPVPKPLILPGLVVPRKGEGIL